MSMEIWALTPQYLDKDAFVDFLDKVLAEEYISKLFKDDSYLDNLKERCSKLGNLQGLLVGDQEAAILQLKGLISFASSYDMSLAQLIFRSVPKTLQGALLLSGLDANIVEGLKSCVTKTQPTDDIHVQCFTLSELQEVVGEIKEGIQILAPHRPEKTTVVIPLEPFTVGLEKMEISFRNIVNRSHSSESLPRNNQQTRG